MSDDGAGYWNDTYNSTGGMSDDDRKKLQAIYDSLTGGANYGGNPNEYGAGQSPSTNLPEGVTFANGVISQATPEEKALFGRNYDYANKSADSAMKFLNLGDSVQQFNPDYAGLTNTAMSDQKSIQNLLKQLTGEYGTNMGNLTNEYNTQSAALQNGQINPAFQAAREAAMRKGTNNLVGNAFSSMYKKGLVGGTDMRNQENSLNDAISQKMMEGFFQDIGTSSDLLEKRTGTLSNLYGNKTKQTQDLYANQMANTTKPLETAQAGQSAAQSAAKGYYSQAADNFQPANALFGTLADQRYSMAAPNSYISQNKQTSSGNSCFRADTYINTPSGKKLITEIKVDDEVYTLGKEIVKVTSLMVPRENDIFEMKTDEGTLYCTLSQPFYNEHFIEVTLEQLEVGDLIVREDCLAQIISVTPAGRGMVYDFMTETGDYLVDGFLASDLED